VHSSRVKSPMSHIPAVSALGRAAAVESRLRSLVPLWALVSVALWAPPVTDARHSRDDADPEILNHAWRLACGQPLDHPVDAPPWKGARDRPNPSRDRRTEG